VKPFVRLFLPAVLPAAGLMAQEVPPADLAALLREAERNSPALLAAAARAEAAREVPSREAAPPDPEISLAYTNDGVDAFTLGEREFSALALTWTQELPHPGKRPARGEAAGFEAERAGREHDRVRLEVLAEVKRAHADLYRADRTAALLDETRPLLQILAETARRRYEVGDGAQESILKAQVEILRLEAERARLDAERQAAAARLNAAVGRAAGTAVGPVLLLPEGIAADEAAVPEAAIEDSPAIAALQAEVRRAETAERLARLDLRPDFVWSASYQNRGGLDPMVAGMFGVRLPLYRGRKQEPALREAAARLRAARHAVDEERNAIRARVGERLAAVRRSETLLRLLGDGVIPQARLALDSARSSYSVGRVGFLDLLTDVGVLLRARAEHVTEETERIRALVDLEPLLGRELVRPRAGSAGSGETGGGR
jgi:outer membrane protein TolC